LKTEAKPIGKVSVFLKTEAKPIGKVSVFLKTEAKPTGKVSVFLKTEAKPVGKVSVFLKTEAKPIGKVSVFLKTEAKPVGKVSGQPHQKFIIFLRYSTFNAALYWPDKVSGYYNCRTCRHGADILNSLYCSISNIFF
ncbi:MAG: hypothetical protein LBJ01_10860, partial [Tannerella sp.]|jgi:hypothetical protein|nr:hypothetical protein [Tannerella sp.]